MTCRSFDSLQICDGKSSKIKCKPSASTPLSQVEIAVETRYERHSTAQSIISVDGQLGDEPHGSSLDGDFERATENPDQRKRSLL